MSFTREVFLERLPDDKYDTYLTVYAEDAEVKLIGLGLGNTVLVKLPTNEIENVAFEDVKGMRLQ